MHKLCYKGSNAVIHLSMKMNAFTKVCAVLSLVLCIILGAIFGASVSGTGAGNATCVAKVQQQVAR